MATGVKTRERAKALISHFRICQTAKSRPGSRRCIRAGTLDKVTPGNLPSVRKAAPVAVLATLVLGCSVQPSAAQTPDFIFSVTQFVADMSIAGPSCGVRDRVWAIRLTYKFRAALSALPPPIAAQLPDASTESAWNALIHRQDQTRASIRKDPKGFCALAISPERLKHADALANGTMSFW